MATNQPNQQPQTPPRPEQSYERADPNAEPGMGALDKDKHTPTDRPDQLENASSRRPDGTQLKTDRTENLGRPTQPVVPEDQIEGDMTSEEPLGWDQAPKDIHDPQQKRHPRPDGVGGSERDPGTRKNQ